MRSTRRREGELVALPFNQKEQRLLEKSVATIRLEASYSLKLLQLGNRGIKVYFRQLRDKVSRLKSHLTADEIQELRQLEVEGKLQTTHTTVNLGSALKIAATNRRLYPAHKGRPASALSRVSHTQTPDIESGPSQRGLLKRSNSVTGVFVNAPPVQLGYRSASASITLGRHASDLNVLAKGTGGNKQKSVSAFMADIKEESNPSGSNPRDSRWRKPDFRGSKTSQDHQQNLQDLPFPFDLQQTESESQQTGPTFTDSQHPQKPDSLTGVGEQEPLCETPTSKARSRSVHSRHRSSSARTAFSSHAATEKAQSEAENRSHCDIITPRSRYSSFDKGPSFLGLLQDDAVDDFDEKLYEERRAEFLDEEKLRAASLIHRKDKFLKDLNQYLREHPLPSFKPRRHGSTRKTTSKKTKETAAGEEKDQTEAMLRRRRVEFDLNPTCLPEENYRERLMNLWKDMNKCRYLRLSDDRLDVSGVNTLATDTLKLYKVLKHQDRKPTQSVCATAKET